MVSLRCKMVVKAAAEELKIPYNAIELGFINVNEKLSETTLEKFKKKLGIIRKFLTKKNSFWILHKRCTLKISVPLD